MTKKIIKYTILPQELYVHRNADKQLKRIIEEMQRPGYVLVARQMGKTNLLFNAKRELESNNQLFVYVDLSNLFDTATECFRNIINMIIEPNHEKFSNVIDKINDIRAKTPQQPPHLEFSNSLLVILKEFKGKIVIILDEIDALMSVNYSDQIFAQIRSTYFGGRANFPEFNNLTYILSGVVEPTELIRDRNKSPFNIGEKIYLDDFSFEEYSDFLNKCELNLNMECINELFDWTKGNPRMTFDICSEIENVIHDNTFLKKEDISSIIKKMYLTNFDISPIDHIRELIRNNSNVRNGVLKILNSQQTDLSDELRKKLYLFGIIDSNYENAEIKIKNRIIQESLTLDWIESVEIENKSLYELGLQKIDEKDYEKAIIFFKQYLESSNNIPKNNREISYYNLGYAYHTLKNYEKSNEYFLEKIISKDDFPNYHYKSKLYIGLNYIILEEEQQGFKFFEDIIDNYKKGSTYMNACLNLAINLKDNERSQRLLDNILEYLVEFEKDEELSFVEKQKMKILALYYKSRNFLMNENNREQYFNHLKLAEECLFEQFKPAILYSLYYQNEDLTYLKKAVNLIINSKLVFDKNDEQPLAFNETILILYFQALISHKHDELIDELIHYSINNIYRFENIDDLYIYAIDNWNVINILNYFSDKIIARASKIKDGFILKKVYRAKCLSLGHLVDDFKNYFKKYQQFENYDTTRPLELNDIRLNIYGVVYYYDKKSYGEALQILLNLEKSEESIIGDLRFEFIIVFHWFVNVYEKLFNQKKSLTYALRTLELIEKAKNEIKKTSLIEDTSLEFVRKFSLSIKDKYKKEISSKQKFGRNDRITVKYSDSNKIVIDKYKKLMDDIDDGKCEIMPTGAGF